MLSFLEMCLRFGVSFVVAGRTSSGKTTLLNSLLNSVPDNKRIYTIESGARELSLLKRDAEGRVINNVVHTLSRPSENPNSDISQEDLVMAALRFDPDVICVGEMRDAEAHSAIEASSTRPYGRNNRSRRGRHLRPPTHCVPFTAPFSD